MWGDASSTPKKRVKKKKKKQQNNHSQFVEILCFQVFVQRRQHCILLRAASKRLTTAPTLLLLFPKSFFLVNKLVNDVGALIHKTIFLFFCRFPSFPFLLFSVFGGFFCLSVPLKKLSTQLKKFVICYIVRFTVDNTKRHNT